MIETEMKRNVKPKLFLVAAALAAVLALSGWQFLSLQLQPVNPNDNSMIEVRLPESSSASEIAALLAQNGLIRNQKIFLYYCRQKGLDKQLRAGLYELSPSMSLPQVAVQIAQGKVKSKALTVPEGYTVKQIGDLLIKEQICSQQQWQEALLTPGDYAFLPTGFKQADQRLEGFLFPDTYQIDEASSAKDVLNMMLTDFAKVWEQEFAAQAQQRQISVRDTIIIASLIEREAQVPEERQRIAGVIYNRLRTNMPLQIDATIQYSLGQHRETLTYKDLEIESPYNTYKYPGLPAGPIASPGKAAIAAALNPEANEYLYYVAKGDGSHYFSRTYAEHLAAKAKYGL